MNLGAEPSRGSRWHLLAQGSLLDLCMAVLGTAAIAVPKMVFQAQEMSVTFFRPFEVFGVVVLILEE